MGARGLVQASKRMAIHLGFEDVRVIDGAGDNGADLVASKSGRLWVIQSKFTTTGVIDRQGVEDCDRALRFYGADQALLVTNAKLSSGAKRRLSDLKGVNVKVEALEGHQLSRLFSTKLADDLLPKFDARPYQRKAVGEVVRSLDEGSKGLLVMATGLGKSAVAGLVARHYFDQGLSKILVLAHLQELVEQLEESFWPFLPKTVRTQAIHGSLRDTENKSGLVVCTPDSIDRLEDYHPELVIVDEAHHVGPSGQYFEILRFWDSVPRLGLTATPWRGDKYDIEGTFGPASFKMGLAEGMAQGWLSDVNYKIFVDNIDWEAVKSSSKNSYSIGELNKLLFLPARDEEIIDRIQEVWNAVAQPQAILFCASIQHAERMKKLLRSSNSAWARAETIHSGVPKRERQLIMNMFRTRKCPIITCVDILNEGVDVPDVSIVAFLKVTHSRRIFVQQIGRGLRLSNSKARLEVLDFVTDVRRLKELVDLKSEYQGEVEVLDKVDNTSFHFSDPTSGKFIEEWLKDVADLDTEADQVKLDFPMS